MVYIRHVGESLQVGASPHWDPKTRNLYYVDVPNSTLYRYRPSADTVTKARVGSEHLAFAFPVEDNDDQFIAGLGRHIVLLIWDGISDNVCSCNILREIDRQPVLSTNVMNGATIDPYGRLWLATQGGNDSKGAVIPGRGSLYSYTQGALKRHLQEIDVCSGIAFDAETNKMYYCDTLDSKIFRYDYDGENTEISNKQIVLDFKQHNIIGMPAGLTVDSDGNLWVAVKDGSVVLQIDHKTNSILKKIDMPTARITDLVWANKDVNVLYVNTEKALDDQVPEGLAGYMFTVKNLKGFQGFPGYPYKT